jgi:hypothetical protein
MAQRIALVRNGMKWVGSCYPTMRIHRQKIPGDWAGVISGLAAEFR